MATQKLDIILFGATGFTGKYAMRTLYQLTLRANLKWGIAGRNRIKLETILNKFEAENQLQPLKIPIIVADLNDFRSIIAMTSRCRLLLNCCGPFRFMGETVVKACIETGTHHVDVSGEPYYMENMQLKYNKKAEENGIYIVSACGMDSIPSELGAIFLQEKFKGTLNSIETFLKFTDDSSLSDGPSINYGTWESAIYEVSNIKQLKKIRSQLFPKRLPKMKPELPKRFLPFKIGYVNKEWNVLLPHSDRSVMLRTQRYFYENNNQRPIQIQTYLSVENFFNIIILAIIGLFFVTFARFNMGRNLLLKYPEVFSLGFFNKNPSLEKIEKTTFSLTLLGKGWKNENNFEQKPNKAIIVEVKGSNPAYGITCTCAVLASIVILTEKSKLPLKGGVYPPGVLFRKTSLIDQLNENGVEFKFVRVFDI